MVSPIFNIRNRGQVVNTACQWIWEHRRLAFKVMVLPVIIMSILIVLFSLMSQYLLLGIVILGALLLVPVLPNMMFEVVENPENYNYPDRLPYYRELLPLWPHNFWPVLLVTVVGGLVLFVSSFTIVGPLIVEAIMPLAIVILQRNDGVGVQCVVMSANMISGSFVNFLMCVLGSFIIAFSMMGSPWLLVYAVGEFIKLFLDRSVYEAINNLVSGDFFDMLATYLMTMGAVFSFMIVTVIVHFFYGHCIEKTEHPELIDRMEKFSEM